MRTMTLYGTGSATATSVANVTIPKAGKIKGVQVGMAFISSTNNSTLALQLSKVPTNQNQTNAVQDPFVQLMAGGNFTTSGQAHNSVNTFLPVDIDVEAGDLVYLHATIAGTLTYYAHFVLHYS